MISLISKRVRCGGSCDIIECHMVNTAFFHVVSVNQQSNQLAYGILLSKESTTTFLFSLSTFLNIHVPFTVSYLRISQKFCKHFIFSQKMSLCEFFTLLLKLILKKFSSFIIKSTNCLLLLHEKREKKL